MWLRRRFLREKQKNNKIVSKKASSACEKLCVFRDSFEIAYVRSKYCLLKRMMFNKNTNERVIHAKQNQNILRHLD